MAIILYACGPYVVIVDVGTGCSLGRAPRIKETLPNFREWCRVTRHSRVFRGLTGCQRTPGFWGVTFSFCLKFFHNTSFNSISEPTFELRINQCLNCF